MLINCKKFKIKEILKFGKTKNFRKIKNWQRKNLKLKNIKYLFFKQ